MDIQRKFYTVCMNIFVKATLAKKPRTKESEQIAYAYAAVLVALVLCQLFTFDGFLSLLSGFDLPGGEVAARLTGSIIVVIEVFALPFLLGMNLSPLMRIISMVLGWLVPLAWLKLSFWLIITSSAASNIGFLGTLVRVTPGWWAVFVCLALGIMAAWASWGMWPIERRKRH